MSVLRRKIFCLLLLFRNTSCVPYAATLVVAVVKLGSTNIPSDYAETLAWHVRPSGKTTQLSGGRLVDRMRTLVSHSLFDRMDSNRKQNPNNALHKISRRKILTVLVKRREVRRSFVFCTCEGNTNDLSAINKGWDKGNTFCQEWHGRCHVAIC